jgi:hypothetical protein
MHRHQPQAGDFAASGLVPDTSRFKPYIIRSDAPFAVTFDRTLLRFLGRVAG